MTKLVFLSTAALVTALALGPSANVSADQAGFHGARDSTANRISPFVPDQTFCASQDLGVWTILFDDSREDVAFALEEFEASYLLDGEELEVQTSAIKPVVLIDPGGGEVPDGPPDFWRASIGDPQVGPLTVGDHDLITTLVFFGEVFVLPITFSIDDC